MAINGINTMLFAIWKRLNYKAASSTYEKWQFFDATTDIQGESEVDSTSEKSCRVVKIEHFEDIYLCPKMYRIGNIV